MGYFKRFGDFCAAFGVFAAVMYIFSQYMAFDFEEIESLTEKLKYFFSNEPRKDYRYYIPLILLLVISFTLSTLLHKYPQFTLAVSVLPMIQIITMLDGDKLYERPMLYVVLSGAHIAGCLFECIRRDREDNARRAAFAVDLLGLCAAGFCVYVLITADGIADLDHGKANIFETQLWMLLSYSAPDLGILKYTAVCFGVLVALRLILRDLYYLDALLSLIPLVSLVYLWNSEKIPIFGSVLVTLAFVYAISRFSVMLLCKPKIVNKA